MPFLPWAAGVVVVTTAVPVRGAAASRGCGAPRTCVEEACGAPAVIGAGIVGTGAAGAFAWTGVGWTGDGVTWTGATGAGLFWLGFGRGMPGSVRSPSCARAGLASEPAATSK